MAAPDLTGAVFDNPGVADIASFDPPPPPRGPLGEIGTGLARGALVGLPSFAGQALQFASSPGNPVYNFGKSLVQSAEERGQKPSLQLQPESHGMVTNALASGAEMVAPAAAVPLAIGAGASALGASPLVAGGAAIAGAGALFGAQAGQATLDKAEKAGVDPETAQTAARLNAASTFATQTALGAVGGRLLGVFGTTMGKMVGAEAGPLAEDTLRALTGTQGMVKPLLKQLPATAAEAVGINAAQAGAGAAIENAYGIDNTSPVDAMKAQIGPTLGLTALLTPLGLVARGAQARSAQARTATLANGESAPEIRAQLAGEYASALQKVDPQAAGAFRLNANLAIQHKLNMDVDSSMFDPATMAARIPQEPTTSLGAAPSAEAKTATEVPVPDFSTSPGAAPETPANSVDFTRTVDTSGIELAELHNQIKSDLVAAGETPAQPLTRKEFAASDVGADLKGQERAKAYQAYLDDPKTTEDLMRQDSIAHDVLQAKLAAQREAEGVAADAAAPPKTAMADAMTAAIKKRDENAAFAEREAVKAQQVEAIANITKGAQLAEDASAGRVKPDANAPKPRAEVISDWKDASEAAGLGVKSQNRVPFEKAVDALGIGDMATHQEQIDAMLGLASDKKRSQGIRDAADAVAASWLSDMPAKAEEPKPIETTEAQAAKSDAQVAREPEGTPTGRQALLDGLEQPGISREQVLDTLHERAQAEAAALVANPDPAKAEALQTKLDHMASVENEAKLRDVADSSSQLEGEAPAASARALGENIAPKPPTIPGVAPNIVPKPPGKRTLEAKREARAQQQQAAKETAAAQPKDNEVAQGDAKVSTVSQRADETADQIAALRADFAARLRAGEKLTPLEKERQEDLGGFARAIDSYTEGKASPSDAGYVDAIAQFVYEASQPYKKTKRGTAGVEGVRFSPLPGPKMENAAQADMGLLAPAAVSHRVADVMAHLEENGSAPWVKTLAAKLKPLVSDITIFPGGRDATRVSMPGSAFDGAEAAAEFDLADKTIRVFPRGASEEVILHETTHAATSYALDAAARIGRPKTQREAQLKASYQELEAIRALALNTANARKTIDGLPHYGLANAHEFVAELYSKREFQDFLRNTGGDTSLWGRAVDAVRRLLGFGPRDANLLDRAMTASEAFFDPAEVRREFDASPQMAARMVEQTLFRAVQAVDSNRTPLNKLSERLFKAFLPVTTVDFIAHGVRGITELVASGFSRGVDLHQIANAAHAATTGYLNTAGSRFIDRLASALRAAGDANKVYALQREMATIGMEASRIGFDFRKNGKDNLAADKSLDPADKPYMDEIHRRFTQLQAQNPELAKSLEAGERLNRWLLINKVATIGANMMDARAGVARRLAAELERMDPADARRAELASQVAATTLESTFAAKYAKSMDFMDPTLRDATNSDPVRFHDGTASEMYKRLNTAFAAARLLPDGSALRVNLQALESLYRAQVKNPYFSLGRQGDYFVKVGFKGIDKAANDRIQAVLASTNKVVGDLARGDDHAFFRFDTASQAQAVHDKLVLAGEGRVVDTAWGLLAEHPNEVSGASPALRTLLGSLDEMVEHQPGLKADQAALMKDAITRQILSMLPETASRSASMGRRGVPGYDANFVTTFAKRAQAAVHDTAGLYTNRAYAEAAKVRTDAIEQLNRTGSAEGRVRAQQVDNEINLRFANGMKPASIPAVSAVTSMSHSFYLGMSPAFYIRTAAQPWHRGLPIIGSKFGYAQGMGALASATPVALKVVANTIRAAVAKDGVRGVLGAPIELKGLELPPREQAFIEELHLRGVLDLGESAQLARAALGDGASQKMRDALRMASFTAQSAEMTNRLSMGLAAFRLAEQRPNLLGKGETSTEYAIKAINLAMDNFDPNNTARAIGRHGFAGPLTPLFTQFQNYALQTTQQIARTVHDGFFGQDKSPEGLQRAAEAKREFAGLMATTAMISGALGLPFASAFAGVYNMFTSDQDKPEDVRTSIKNWAADTFGKDVAGVLLHGPANLLNVDTSTFGLQGILPGSDFLDSRALWKDRSEAELRNMMGPAVSLGLDLSTAISKMSDGYWLKGIEAALPVGLRTYFKTEELARLGAYTDSKGHPLPINVGAGDLAWRALGFQTAEKADQGEAARDFTTNQQLLKHRRGVIADRFIDGVTDQDPSELADARQALQAFNAKNPTQPITSQELRGALQEHMVSHALGMASGTGVTVSKRQLPSLLQSERFAAMPGR